MDKILKANLSVLDIAKFWMHVKIIRSSSPFNLRYGLCWEWQGTLFSNGYGHFVCHQISYRAHRISYYLYNGNISSEKIICHRCDNPKCVNPKHLFEGDCKDNSQDREKKGRGRKTGGLWKKRSSKYAGIYYRKDNKKWRVRKVINGKVFYLGQYNTEEEAKAAYDSFLFDRSIQNIAICNNHIALSVLPKI